jgi:hypothetical protein
MHRNLKPRYEALHDEMVDQFERTVVLENHWVMYVLLAWQNLVACVFSYVLLEIYELHYPRWPYAAIWLIQAGIALATFRYFSGKPRIEESPLEPINKRIWLVFLFLCFNVAILNILLGLPVFVMLPALAGIGSFAFTAMTALISKRFSIAGLWMFATGIIMARFPEYGFLLYGASWWIVLHILALIFYRKRHRYAADIELPSAAAIPISRAVEPAESRPSLTR